MQRSESGCSRSLRRIARLAAILVVAGVAAGCGTTALHSPGTPSTSGLVRFCELLSIPQGTEVRLHSIYRGGFEESILVDEKNCLEGLGFWVEFAEGWRDRSDRLALSRFDAARGEQMLVDFYGTYACGADAGSSENLRFYYCRFTVS